MCSSSADEESIRTRTSGRRFASLPAAWIPPSRGIRTSRMARSISCTVASSSASAPSAASATTSRSFSAESASRSPRRNSGWSSASRILVVRATGRSSFAPRRLAEMGARSPGRPRRPGRPALAAARTQSFRDTSSRTVRVAGQVAAGAAVTDHEHVLAALAVVRAIAACSRGHRRDQRDERNGRHDRESRSACLHVTPPVRRRPRSRLARLPACVGNASVCGRCKPGHRRPLRGT